MECHNKITQTFTSNKRKKSNQNYFIIKSIQQIKLSLSRGDNEVARVKS